ncbi:type II secretion system protein [bacterium]|nr:type II secretion system protein [bacterium]
MRQKGFTLIELIVVIAIISILAVSSILGLNSLMDRDVGTVSRDFASNVRYLFDHAALTNSYIKIEFDFEENKYSSKASTERFLLFDTASERFKKREEAIIEAEKKEAEKLSLFEEQSISTVKRFKQGNFESITADETLNFEVKLPENIKIKSVYTDFYGDYISSGKAEIIIFPNGKIQESIFVFQEGEEEDEDSVISVKISPYSGDIDMILGVFDLSELENHEDD